MAFSSHFIDCFTIFFPKWSDCVQCKGIFDKDFLKTTASKRWVYFIKLSFTDSVWKWSNDDGSKLVHRSSIWIGSKILCERKLNKIHSLFWSCCFQKSLSMDFHKLTLESSSLITLDFNLANYTNSSLKNWDEIWTLLLGLHLNLKNAFQWNYKRRPILLEILNWISI